MRINPLTKEIWQQLFHWNKNPLYCFENLSDFPSNVFYPFLICLFIRFSVHDISQDQQNASFSLKRSRKFYLLIQIEVVLMAPILAILFQNVGMISIYHIRQKKSRYCIPIPSHKQHLLQIFTQNCCKLLQQKNGSSYQFHTFLKHL